MRKIVIAGGSGFLGDCLDRHFNDPGDQVIILTRGNDQLKNETQFVHWDGRTKGSWCKVLEGADVLINLNGKSVDCRYTEENKRLIYSTRLESTEILGKAVQLCSVPPKVWINAASATIYRHSLDKEMDEYSGEIGTGFSVDVCEKWEAVFNSIAVPGTRKVLIRTGIVLGKRQGPLKPLKMLVRFGLGGHQGRGDQYFSWLHEDDFVKSIEFLINDQEATGAFNVTAPAPIPNSHFMKAMRKAMGIPIGLPTPVWLLETGAVLIRTETELILKSRRVVPRRLLESGYAFSFNTIEDALADLCR
jgi:uncharacterized protein (TIGR01777 family)